jgi:hypothetical protein
LCVERRNKGIGHKNIFKKSTYALPSDSTHEVSQKTLIKPSDIFRQSSEDEKGVLELQVIRQA